MWPLVTEKQPIVPFVLPSTREPAAELSLEGQLRVWAPAVLSFSKVIEAKSFILELLKMFFFLSLCQAWSSTRGQPSTTSSCVGVPSTSTGTFRATTRQRTWRRRAPAIPHCPPGRYGCPWSPSGPTAPYTPLSWGHSHGPASVWPLSAPACCPETTSARTVTQERWSSV